MALAVTTLLASTVVRQQGEQPDVHDVGGAADDQELGQFPVLDGRCRRTVSIRLTGRVYGGTAGLPADTSRSVGRVSARQPA